MSFLTAASERSSSGSGVSGASVASFSGASSFSFSLAAALVLVAIRFSPPDAPSWGTSITHLTPNDTHHPYPMRGESIRRTGDPGTPLWHPRHRLRPPDSGPDGVSPGPLKPRLTLHTAESSS